MALSTLTVDLVVKKLDQFDNDLKRASRSSEQQAKKMAAAFDGVKKAFGAAFAGVTAGAAYKAFVTDIAEAGVQVQRLSQVANASAGDFQRLAYGAESAGVPMEKYADILKDTNDKIGEFVAVGGGPLKDFFDNIAPAVGLTADEFARLSGPEALQAYYDALQKAGLSQQQMTFYMEALASDATALIPLLRDGGRGFAEMGDQAEALGRVMSDDLVKSSAEFDKNMRELNAQMQGFRNQVGEQVIPVLTDLVSQFNDANDAGLNFMGLFTRNGDPTLSLAQNLDIARQRLAEYRADIEKPWYSQSLFQVVGGDVELKRLEAQVAYFEKRIERGRQRLASAAGADSIPTGGSPSAPRVPPVKTGRARNASAPREDDALKAEAEAREKYVSILESFEQAQLAAVLSGEKLTESERRLLELQESDTWQAMPQVWRDNAEAQAQAAIEAEKVRDAQERLNALLEATPTEQLERQRETMQFLADAYLRGAINAEQFNEAASTALGNLPDQAEEQADRMSVFFDQAARNAQSAFADFLFDPFSDGLDGMLKGFGQTIQRMIADAAAAQIMESLFGASNGNGGRTGGVDFGAVFSSVIGLFAANGAAFNAGGVRAFASGGIVNSPTLFKFADGGAINTGLMGEAGPEAIMPLKRGADGKLGVAGGGGGSVVININQTFTGNADPQRVKTAAGAGARSALQQIEGAQRYG